MCSENLLKSTVQPPAVRISTCVTGAMRFFVRNRDKCGRGEAKSPEVNARELDGLGPGPCHAVCSIGAQSATRGTEGVKTHCS